MKDIKVVAMKGYCDCPEWLNGDFSGEYIKLTGECTKNQVDAVLYSAMGYVGVELSDSPKETLLRYLTVLERGEAILWGGIMFSDDEKVILPSCCCGLEEWQEIMADICGRNKPWLGHDPFGTCIYDEKFITVCSDDPLMYETEEKKKNADSCIKIEFTYNEMNSLLNKAEKGVEEFISKPLKSRITELCPEIAVAFCNGWRKSFYKKVK